MKEDNHPSHCWALNRNEFDTPELPARVEGTPNAE
jgi:hypothetical protein